MHDGQLRRTAAGRCHGQLGVVRRPPGKNCRVHLERGVGVVHLADHVLHLDAVATGQEMPELDVPGGRGGGISAAPGQGRRGEHASQRCASGQQPAPGQLPVVEKIKLLHPSLLWMGPLKVIPLPQPLLPGVPHRSPASSGVTHASHYIDVMCPATKIVSVRKVIPLSRFDATPVAGAARRA
ncbi:hypothetical protein ARTHRO8AJ_70006 [Arthrobacter sp. 8AJ]|nr:hypothetical protein ARTHRO8AJ_70006 [Arthrobacter sp. 8AJ]